MFLKTKSKAQFHFTVESIARLYADKGFFEPIWSAWQFYFYIDDDKRSQKIWQEFFTPENHLRFYYILDRARKEINPIIIEKLVEQLETAGLSKKALGLVYSCWINVYCHQFDYDAMNKVLERAVNDVGITNLNRGCLEKVKSTLQHIGQELPYEIPESMPFRKKKSKSNQYDEGAEEEIIIK